MSSPAACWSRGPTSTPHPALVVRALSFVRLETGWEFPGVEGLGVANFYEIFGGDRGRKVLYLGT